MWVECWGWVQQGSSFEQRAAMMEVRLEWQKKMKNAGWKCVRQAVGEEWVNEAEVVGEEGVNEAEVVGEDEIQQGCSSTICNLLGRIHQVNKRNCQSGEPNL